jgi:hypothetical protein
MKVMVIQRSNDEAPACRGFAGAPPAGGTETQAALTLTVWRFSGPFTA